MRDDNALFHSIEVYDGIKPHKIKKIEIVLIRLLILQVWDLRKKVAEKIRQCHQKYTIDDG